MRTSLVNIVVIFHLFGGIWGSRPPSAPSKGIVIQASCSREFFIMQFHMEKPFRGVVFAKEFLNECHARGKSLNDNSIS